MKKSNLKKEYANKLLESGIEPYSVVRHSFANNRLNNKLMRRESQNTNLLSTISTRVDCLGIVEKMSGGGIKICLP